MLKKIGKILAIGLILLVVGFLCFKYSWEVFDDESELTNFSKKVENTRRIPDSLMQIYVAVFPYNDSKSTTREIIVGYGSNLHKGVAKYYDNCFCDEIIRKDFFGYTRYNNVIIRRIESLRLSFGLESIVGSRACLNYYLTGEFQELKRNINEYHPYTWKHKELNELSKNEFIEYLTIKDGPTYFSKFLKPERFDRRKRIIEEKIKNASL